MVGSQGHEGNGALGGRPVRWAVLTDDFPPADGGIATWTALAADALDARVFARDRPGLVGATGVRGPSFRRWGGLWMLGSPGWLAADAVLASTWRMATAAGPICAARGVPLHVVVHGADARELRRPPGARVWAVSRDLALRVRVLARVLPSPVAIGPCAPASVTPWVFAGRAVRGKGGERFVRLAAAAGVPAEVWGDGPELPRWRALAARLGADVVFRGRLTRTEVLARFERGGLAFLLSEARPDGSGEGLGLALLEAASRGVPSVGSRTGGIPEAAGLILDDPDDPARSVQQIRAWWTPSRGIEARERLARLHGPARLRAALEGLHPPSRPLGE